MRLINGDCLEKLKELPDNSVDAIVTDPPAGIAFMNKEWDKDKGGRDKWMQWMTEVFTEVHRVLKSGGHGLVWAIPRTSHWTAMAIENAGFEIRDCVYHIQSQGFPKSLNVSKAIDKRMGLQGHESKMFNHAGHMKYNNIQDKSFRKDYGYEGYTAKDDLAKLYDGYGSQLKPAVECWWLIRKPLQGSIVDNVLLNGCGGINIDKSRIGTEEMHNPVYSNGGDLMTNFKGGELKWSGETNTTQGRFPSNLIHDGSDAVMQEFAKYGESKSSSAEWKETYAIGDKNNTYTTSTFKNHKPLFGGYDDSGSIARYFYCAKTSVSERNLGLDEFEEKPAQPQKNNHPTVKPVKLMSYLVNLIAPPIREDYTPVVLDMFMGTGSTGIAALLNGYDFIGIEMSEEYMKIAEARINNYEEFRKFLK